MSSYTIRPAERRDLGALSALAQEQAAARRAVDPRLSASPQIIPFLSHAETLTDVLSWRHHVTLVARQDTASSRADGAAAGLRPAASQEGKIIGGINLHRVEQNDRDQFAAYYPRRFTSIGLLAARDDAPAGARPSPSAAANAAPRGTRAEGIAASVIVDLLTRAREQAARWKTPTLLVHNATSDCALRAALNGFGFRTFYHYALRSAGAPSRSGVLPGAGSSPAKTAGQVEPGGAQLITSAEPAEASHSIRKPDVDGLMVRHASAADLDAIVRLGIQSVNYHASLEPAMQVPRGEDGKMRRRFEAILREPQHSALFVAVLDWQVVGFYSLYLQSIDETWTPPLFVPGRYGLLAEVAVAEGLRGRGIGRRLFATVDQWFRERGAHQLWLIYLPRNPLSSRFWPALGFEPVWDVLVADGGSP
jgi:GNAT superfamily N-acetyltransferase